MVVALLRIHLRNNADDLLSIVRQHADHP
jgi:hypothetical protein